MTLILFLIFFAFFIEGIGFNNVHENILYFYLILPTVLFFYLVYKRINVRFPVLATTFYGLFLFAIFIGNFFFSVDKQASFVQMFFYLSLFLIFVFFQNVKINDKKIFGFLALVGAALSFYGFIFQKKPVVEVLQLTYSTFGAHNHLGDFLGLVLVAGFTLFLKKEEIVYALIFIVFLPFYLFSFSRSSYLAFIPIATYVFARLKSQKPRLLWLIVFMVIFLISGFFFTNTGSKVDPYSNRVAYAKQSVLAFISRPLFGYGQSNYYVATLRHKNLYYDTTTFAHNIFLEQGVENGGVGLFFFLGFIVILLRSALKSREFAAFGFLYLLLNFQTDYTYKIYGLLVLFFIFSGLFHRENKAVGATWFFGFLSLIPIVAIFFILTSAVLLKRGIPDLAIRFYPFNKQAYRAAIANALKDKKYSLVSVLASDLEKVAPYDLSSTLYIADIYEDTGRDYMSFKTQEAAYSVYRVLPFSIVEKIYLYKRKFESSGAASIFISDFFRYLEDKIPYWQVYEAYGKEIKSFCKKYKSEVCYRYIR